MSESSFVCLLSVFLSFSVAAALQVSISLNKVELSVGESKFFICTGRFFTHTHAHTNGFFSTLVCLEAGQGPSWGS